MPRPLPLSSDERTVFVTAEQKRRNALVAQYRVKDKIARLQEQIAMLHMEQDYWQRDIERLDDIIRHYESLIAERTADDRTVQADNLRYRVTQMQRKIANLEGRSVYDEQAQDEVVEALAKGVDTLGIDVPQRRIVRKF